LPGDVAGIARSTRASETQSIGFAGPFETATVTVAFGETVTTRRRTLTSIVGGNRRLTTDPVAEEMGRM
jgi:hypothetical protein